MAQTTTELTKLEAFIDDLRYHGFNVGIDQYIAVQHILTELATRRHLPDNLCKFRTLLAPIVCNSKAEQERFYEVFDQWTTEHQNLLLNQLTNDDSAASEGVFYREAQEESRRPRNITWQLLTVITLLFLGTAIALIYKRYIPPPSHPDSQTVARPTVAPSDTPGAKPSESADAGPFPSRSIPAIPSPTPSTPQLVDSSFDPIRFAFVLIPYLIAGIWWGLMVSRSRAQLEHWGTTLRPPLLNIHVKGVKEKLFHSPAFRHIAKELQRHRRAGPSYLDVNSTVAATVRTGGWFTPVYGLSSVRPDYLALIDRVSFRDQQAHLFNEVIKRLREYDVFVDAYYYHGDPRVCRKGDPKAARLTLRDLVALHPDSHLLIFSDGSELINQLTGQPESWLEMFSRWPRRALLTPEAVVNWGYREWAIAGSGFTVLPAIEDGLTALVDTGHTGAVHLTRSGRPHQYPQLLKERPERWLESGPPEETALNGLCVPIWKFICRKNYQRVSPAKLRRFTSLMLNLFGLGIEFLEAVSL